MSKNKRQLFQDILILIASISIALFFLKTGIAYKFITSLGDLQYFGVITAGMFFTSVFTTAPSIVLLGEFAQTVPLPVLVVLGGIGATLGDYVIFRFVKDRVSDDFKYLLSFSKPNRFSVIFKTRLFKFFVPFIGALIIASPFPDEIGIMMLGISRVRNKTFFLISFISNSAGILAIGLVAKIIANF